MRLPFRDYDVSVVEKPIDGGGRQTLGEEGVEARRMEVGGQDQAAPLVGGVA
jgi:hypothetical protein